MLTDFAQTLMEHQEKWLRLCVDRYSTEKFDTEEQRYEYVQKHFQLVQYVGEPLVQFLIHKGTPVAVCDMRVRPEGTQYTALRGYLNIPDEYRPMCPIPKEMS